MKRHRLLLEDRQPLLGSDRGRGRGATIKAIKRTLRVSDEHMHVCPCIPYVHAPNSTIKFNYNCNCVCTLYCVSFIYHSMPLTRTVMYNSENGRAHLSAHSPGLKPHAFDQRYAVVALGSSPMLLIGAMLS